LPGRDVLGHERPRGDERLLTDLDARKEHHPAAHARAPADHRAPDLFVARLRAPHEVVVGGDHAWRDEDVLLELRIRREVGVRLDPAERSDRDAVLYADATPDHHRLTEPQTLSQQGLLA